MNRDDVIRMALEAANAIADPFATGFCDDRMVNAFAAIIAQRIDEAVSAEREACAKVCEETAWSEDIGIWRLMTKQAIAVRSMTECAAAIRARSACKGGL